jgi:lipid II:glycine glycyltransferase (peptidoglycan interpeptide bridge formation enzyme)
MSLDRRKSRGEQVQGGEEHQRYWTYIKQGHGNLFQAVLDGKVLSSLLVIKAEKGAYYQSAGTSPEGMTAGASHFLIYETAQLLQRQSFEVFNLGGAEINDASRGLRLFKEGFGSTPVELEAVRVFCGSPLKRRGIQMIRMMFKQYRECKRIFQLAKV